MKYHLIKAALLSALSYSALAGDMGPRICPPSCSDPLLGFISAEGGYTWAASGGIRFTIIDVITVRSREERSGGTARLAFGLIKPICDTWRVSSEIGYGYYGSVKSSFGSLAALGVPSSNIFTMKYGLDGFDALAGVSYHIPALDVFFKAGALILNTREKLIADFTGGASLVPFVTGAATLHTSRTQALPEIKLGASYHICDNLGLFAAWTHAFGSRPQLHASLSPALLSTSLYANFQSPTIDVATLGLQYTFG